MSRDMTQQVFSYYNFDSFSKTDITKLTDDKLKLKFNKIDNKHFLLCKLPTTLFVLNRLECLLNKKEKTF